MPDKVKELVELIYVFHKDVWYEFKTTKQVKAFIKYKGNYAVNRYLKDGGGWYKDWFITTNKNNFVKKPRILEIDINNNVVLNTYINTFDICKKHSIPRSTLYRWIKNKKSFNNLLFKIETI